jgi:hypothetical protein
MYKFENKYNLQDTNYQQTSKLAALRKYPIPEKLMQDRVFSDNQKFMRETIPDMTRYHPTLPDLPPEQENCNGANIRYPKKLMQNPGVLLITRHLCVKRYPMRTRYHPTSPGSPPEPENCLGANTRYPKKLM